MIRRADIANFRRVLTASCLGSILLAAGPSFGHDTAGIDWDPTTIRLLQPVATYGRMKRLAGGTILCCFERGGRSWVVRSEDEMKTWGASIQIAAFAAGAAANPELCALRDGRVLLFYNERPRSQGGEHAYTIRMSVSRDGGRSWRPRGEPVFVAGNTRHTACWEPAAVESPDGSVHLFFSRELGGDQEIVAMTSRDGGNTWSVPCRASFRPGHRDGMPVPLLLADGRLVFSIEDNGLAGNARRPLPFRPTIVDWKARQRWMALATTPPAGSNLAAPYLARFPTGETILSVQSTENRTGRKRMTVYVGTADATDFANRTLPFDQRPEADELWNSLFVLDADRVLALSNTRIHGRRGLWCVTGRRMASSGDTDP